MTSVGKSAEKIWEALQRHPRNVRFSDFLKVVTWFGFIRKGGKGSHQTFFHPRVKEILDLQPLHGEAKPYQIRQFIRVVMAYSLEGRHE